MLQSAYLTEVIRHGQPEIAPRFNDTPDRAEELEHAEGDKADSDCDTDEMAAVNLFMADLVREPAAITRAMKTIKPQKEKSSLSSKLNLFISETP